MLATLTKPTAAATTELAAASAATKSSTLSAQPLPPHKHFMKPMADESRYQVMEQQQQQQRAQQQQQQQLKQQQQQEHNFMSAAAATLSSSPRHHVQQQQHYNSITNASDKMVKLLARTAIATTNAAATLPSTSLSASLSKQQQQHQQMPFNITQQQQQQIKQQLKQQQKQLHIQLQYGGGSSNSNIAMAAIKQTQPPNQISMLSHHNAAQQNQSQAQGQSQNLLVGAATQLNSNTETTMTTAMSSLSSEQHLCQLYNNQQHSDYIISDYMDKIATRISLLETELKFAWRALDLLSGEYSKMWARLEKLENISVEQQSVVTNLMDLYAEKNQHDQQQQAALIAAAAAAEQTAYDFVVVDDGDGGPTLADVVIAAAAAEQQSMQQQEQATSHEFNSLLEELKNEALDNSTATPMSRELSKLLLPLQQREAANAVATVKSPYDAYTLLDVDEPMLFKSTNYKDGLLSTASRRNNTKSAAAAAREKIFSDSDVLFYEQQQQQELLAQNAKTQLLREFLHGRQVLKNISTHHHAPGGPGHHYDRATGGGGGSMCNLANDSMDNNSSNLDNLPKAHSYAHLRQELNSCEEQRQLLRGGSTFNNMSSTTSELDQLNEQLQFFRQAASKTGEGGLMSVPIDDSGGGGRGAVGPAPEILLGDEMNEDFYKTLNQAYRDDNFMPEITNMELILQQSEAAHESISGGLCSRPISSLGMIYEEENEEEQTKTNGVSAVVATTTASTHLTTTPTATAVSNKKSKKSKKKKQQHHKDEMELLNSLKTALAQMTNKTTDPSTTQGNQVITATSYSADLRHAAHTSPTPPTTINITADNLAPIVDILVNEIVKIKQLSTLSAAQLQQLQRLIKNERKFFEKIQQVDKNLISLLLNPVIMSEELALMPPSTNDKFELVLRKLTKNIETFKKLVGNSFDDAVNQQQQNSVDHDSSIIIRADDTSNASGLSDYSAHLLRNNINLNEQLKLLEYKECEMRQKKLIAAASASQENIVAAAKDGRRYFDADNFLDITAEQERALLHDHHRPHDATAAEFKTFSSSNIYNNDEYIKSLKRSLERHNSMLFLLHLQNPESTVASAAALDVETMLLGGNESPPPPAPNNDMLLLLHQSAANSNSDNDELAKVINPFHEEIYQQQKSSGGSKQPQHLSVLQFDTLTGGGTPKKTKSDSGLSSMSGLSSWEKSPNSPNSSNVGPISRFGSSYGYVGTVSLLTAASRENNPFLGKTYEANLVQQGGGGNELLECLAKATNDDDDYCTATAASTTAANVIQCPLIPPPPPSTLRTAAAVSYATVEQQLPNNQELLHHDYMFSEENLNYIRELSKNMPICSAYETKSIFSNAMQLVGPELQHHGAIFDNMDDTMIRTVDDMLAWDQKHISNSTTNTGSSKQSNQSKKSIMQTDTLNKMPDLLKTEQNSLAAAGMKGIHARRDMPTWNTTKSFYEETDIDNIEMLEQTRNRNLTDRLVFYPSSNSLADYNSSNNLDYLGQNALDGSLNNGRAMGYTRGYYATGLAAAQSAAVAASNQQPTGFWRTTAAATTNQRHVEQLQMLHQQQRQQKFVIELEHKQTHLAGYAAANMAHQLSERPENVQVLPVAAEKHQPKMWNKLTHFIPDNLKLKRSSRYQQRSQSLPSADDVDEDSDGTDMHLRSQAGSYPLVTQQQQLQQQRQKQQQQHQQRQAARHHHSNSGGGGGSLRGFDFSKRLNKLPMQLVRRATYTGGAPPPPANGSGGLAAAAGGSKSKKKRTLSATMNNFMQKAKSYRRHSFGMRSGSSMSDPGEEIGGDVPSLTSSDNDDSLTSDYGGADDLETVTFTRMHGNTTMTDQVEQDDDTEMSPTNLFKQMSQLNSCNDRETAATDNLFPTIGAVVQQKRQQQPLELPALVQVGESTPKELEEIEVASVAMQDYSLNDDEINQHLVDEEEIPHIECQQQEFDKTVPATAVAVVTTATAQDNNRLAAHCLKKTHSIYVEDDGVEEERFILISESTGGQQQPQIAISSNTAITSNAGNMITVGAGNITAANQMRNILKLSQRGSTQASLDVPGSGGGGSSFSSRDDEDNRSQHSYRTVSSSRRQSTEDSIDTDDEYFCYELRQLEELEQRRLIEAAAAAETSIDAAEMEVEANGQHLFTKIDELAAAEYQPDESVKQMMAVVLQELQHVVQRQPDITVAVVVEKAKEAKAIKQQNVYEKFARITDIHSAWQDGNVEDNMQMLHGGHSDADAADIAEEHHLLNDLYSVEANNKREQQKRMKPAFEQQQQFVTAASPPAAPHKRLKKRRTAARKSTSDQLLVDENGGHETIPYSSSSCTSDEEQPPQRRRDAENKKLQRRTSNEIREKTTTARYISDSLSGSDRSKHSDEAESRNNGLESSGGASGATSGPDTPADLTDVENDDADYVPGSGLSYDDFMKHEKQLRNQQQQQQTTESARDATVKEMPLMIGEQPPPKNELFTTVDIVSSGDVAVTTALSTGITTTAITTATSSTASSTPMKSLSHDSSIEGSQAPGGAPGTGGQNGTLGSSKWKLLKTLKEKKIEERNNQDKIKEEELIRDKDKVK